MAVFPEAGKTLPQGVGELLKGRYAAGAFFHRWRTW